jgi:hypothetical protein
VDAPDELRPTSPGRMSIWRWVRSSLCRFSIRELLLLTALVATLIALSSLHFQRQRRLHSTDVAKNVCRVEFWDDVLGRLEMAGPVDGGPASDEPGDFYSRMAIWEFVIPVQVEDRERFMEAAESDVRRVVENAECDVTRSHHFSRRGKTMWFYHDYEKSTVQGRVMVVIEEEDPAKMWLSVFVQEYRNPH